MLNDGAKPKLPETAITFNENEKFVFLIPEKPDWCVTNKNFALALSLCNGKNTIKDIKNKLNHPQIDNCISLLNELNDSKFFNKPESNQYHPIENLYSIHLNMTDTCNLKCIYCYAEERNKKIKPLLSINQYYQLIDELYIINNNATITFTGGEPLLSDKTIPLAEYCKKKGMNTYLLTNGTLITDNNAEKIAKLFDNIRISIDGSNSDIHNQLRGKYSFEKATHGIKLLEQQNNAPKIAMVVNKINMYDIPIMVEKYGSRLTLQPLYNMGRAKKTNIGLTGKEYYNALKQSDDVGINFEKLLKLDQFKNSPCYRCAIGNGEISISPQGDVYPCHMLHTEEFCAGNLFSSNITEIYKKSKTLVKLRKLTVNDKKGCQTCPFRLLCGGGCWARAYYDNGDIKTRDSLCDFEILSIKDGLVNNTYENK